MKPRHWNRSHTILLSGLVIAAATAAGAGALSAPGPNRTTRGRQVARSPRVARTNAAAGRPVDPALFANTACMAYPPTHGNRGLTVFLDAGHGGRDPGSVGRTESGKTIYEADETLPVELDAMALLRADGFRVVVSRTTDSSVARLTPADVSGRLLSAAGVHADVAARAQCANRGHADALVGIYLDAGGPNNAGSVTGYDAARPFAAQNLRLAQLVQHDVLSAMNRRGWAIPNGGVQLDTGLGSAASAAADSYGHLMLLGPAKPGWFTTPSMMPGALIEPLFITDPFEASIAASRVGQHVIAGGIALALEQFLGRRGQRGRSGHH